jgi:CRP-like cAMP-binding protein
MRRTEISQLDEARVQDLGAALAACATFAGIGGPLMAKLVHLGARLELHAGEALIREGEPATAEIYLLVEGTLVVQSKAGFIARLDRPGAVVGEVAVLLSSARTADVLAESAARLVAIPSGILSQPEFAEVATAVRASMLRDDWVKY